MAKEHETRPNGDGHEHRFEDPAVETWAAEPSKIIAYEKGETELPDGSSYSWKAGRRLVIAGKQVMDTCEYPWAEETINRSFSRVGNVSSPVRVLEFGFGMGITAERAIQQLVGKGEGEYQIVELNRDVYKYAQEIWKKRWMETFKGSKEITPESDPKIKINVRFGEAGEEARKLLERGEKFRIIISDTYPIKTEEQGINDLLHIDVMKKLLAKDGVFAFFPYVPGARQGELTARQHKLIAPHFKDINLSNAEVTPPPSYSYLFRKSGPVRSLPVAICTDPIL